MVGIKLPAGLMLAAAWLLLRVLAQALPDSSFVQTCIQTLQQLWFFCLQICLTLLLQVLLHMLLDG